MTEGWSLAVVVACCILWAVYCGILSHVLDQSREADVLATLIGIMVIISAIV